MVGGAWAGGGASKIVGGASRKIAHIFFSHSIHNSYIYVNAHTYIHTHTHTHVHLQAPEVIRMDRAEPDPYTPSCDVYSFGVVIFELITGMLPYPHVQERDQVGQEEGWSCFHSHTAR